MKWKLEITKEYIHETSITFRPVFGASTGATSHSIPWTEHGKIGECYIFPTKTKALLELNRIKTIGGNGIITH